MEVYRVLLLFGCFLIAGSIYVLLQWQKQSPIVKTGKVVKASGNVAEKPSVSASEHAYPPVEPLPDFEWYTEEPRKQRPFKALYHLTMALANSDVSSLIQMDKNYLNRIMFRREVMEAHPEIVLGAYDRVKPAVDEFYTFLFSNYLPTRFPRMFSLCRHEGEETVSVTSCCQQNTQAPTHLYSHVTQEHRSLTPPSTALEALKGIGGMIDDDCQFLLPSEDGDGYALAGFVCCCPSGFKMSDKLGLKLRQIHIPVPHYKEKLEKSMDRYFDKLEVGKFVRRSNWVVSTTPDLFNPKGNHIHEGDEIPDPEDVDISQAILRSELQTVHRLPRSKAILFSFKTYTYPLSEVKDEGSGEELATAIDGMRDGTAPRMFVYKKGVVWGEKVKEYLRS